MKLLNIGFGNMVNADRIIGIVSPDSAPIKRLVQDAREKGALIDASYGRRTQGCAYHGLRPCHFVRHPVGKHHRACCRRKRRKEEVTMKGEKYLFVVSGPSGTGKDTVVAALLKSTPRSSIPSRPRPAHRAMGRRTASTTILCRWRTLRIIWRMTRS